MLSHLLGDDLMQGPELVPGPHRRHGPAHCPAQGQADGAQQQPACRDTSQSSGITERGLTEPSHAPSDQRPLAALPDSDHHVPVLTEHPDNLHDVLISKNHPLAATFSSYHRYLERLTANTFITSHRKKLDFDQYSTLAVRPVSLLYICCSCHNLFT